MNSEQAQRPGAQSAGETTSPIESQTAQINQSGGSASGPDTSATTLTMQPGQGEDDGSGQMDLGRMIAEAAYYRAERRGFAPGYEMEDWIAAEIEIGQRLYDEERGVDPEHTAGG